MSALGNVFKQAGKQTGNLAKHAGKKIADTPFEIVQNAVGIKPSERSEDQAMEDLEQGVGSQQQGDDNFAGFQTKDDFTKYSELAGKRDEILLRQQRRALAREFGVEPGMQRARIEREQAKEQEEKIEEQQEEQEKMFLDEKKKEAPVVAAAKAQTGAETRVGKKIAG